ncbi:MAG: STAS/SEC14 domain-containing protein [Epsilonproteobacteria bacterium]|nr:MAG: STAS/SEC14 domain-containing protein [Campylobacterota bacterium]
MIKIISDLPSNVLGFESSGTVTGKDYETVLIPAVEAKLKEFPKIKLLYHLGPDFTGYDLKAAWDDAKVGLAHLTAWEKIAVVTDIEWVSSGVKVFGFVIPGEVRVFENSKLDTAKEWVSE